MKPAAMKLGVIGRGQAARALVPRWVAAGIELAFWHTRKDGPLESTPPADVLVLAVSDSALREVATTLATRPQARHETWLHLSGVHPAAILRVSDSMPEHVGGMHPLVALAEGADPTGATAGIEGDNTSLPIAENLARAVGLNPIVLTDARARALYHAAAVSVAGHVTALFSQALAMMKAAGLAPDAAQRALQPLLLSAARNLASLAPAQALTGPSVRGDAATITTHLAALSALPLDIAATYRLLSHEALTLAAPRLSDANIAAIAKALSEPSPL